MNSALDCCRLKLQGTDGMPTESYHNQEFSGYSHLPKLHYSYAMPGFEVVDAFLHKLQVVDASTADCCSAGALVHDTSIDTSYCRDIGSIHIASVMSVMGQIRQHADGQLHLPTCCICPLTLHAANKATHSCICPLAAATAAKRCSNSCCAQPFQRCIDMAV